MKTPVATLVNRSKYNNRKGRSAWKKLGKYRLSELIMAGWEPELTPLMDIILNLSLVVE